MLKSNTNTRPVCVSVLAVPLWSPDSLSLGSPDSCSKRQRCRANQLMLIALFTRPRGMRESWGGGGGAQGGGHGGEAQTNTNYHRPVTRRWEGSGGCTALRSCASCFTCRHKQEGQPSCVVHREVCECCRVSFYSPTS